MAHRNPTKKHLRIAAMATAFFIFWITLGSIINFHQHHIFGRSLMPQGILAKREDTITIAHELPVHVLLFTMASGHSETVVPVPACFTIESVSGVVNDLVPKAGIPLFHGLRAPPVA
ncbi:MAG: hypothetical protein V1775_15455 [Bacteroidota bacterium]